MGASFESERRPTMPSSEAVPSGTLPAPTDSVGREAQPSASVVALLSAAGVALAGGLAWAGVVIATRFDIGILAWLIGVATGLTVVHLSGGAVRTSDRVAAGALAAAGILVGKYVIFVHAVKVTFGGLLAARGLNVGYLDTRQMSIFVHGLGQIVHPIYAVWIGLAFIAAFRITRPDAARRVNAIASGRSPQRARIGAVQDDLLEG